MSSVLLVYPYFRRLPDLSIFRRPPLGIAYIAASLRQAGHDVHLMDCTFMTRAGAIQAVRDSRCEVAGIYCMESMLDDCLMIARAMRQSCRLLMAGGPLPTCSPELFLGDFHVVVRGEGERTVVELLAAWEAGADLRSVPGLALRSETGIVTTPDRPFEPDLDNLPFPARDLLPNEKYIRLERRRHGRALASLMSTRGCPYTCEFCSNVIFGGSFRERSAGNILDEVEQALAFGYDGIAFADDVFTMNRSRVKLICSEIHRRGLRLPWECLARVDSIDDELARDMKGAGCRRIFFGIESGDDGTLRLMRKKFSVEQARASVETARRAGLRVGAFFILFYPGDTDATVLKTLRFATSLPLDYLGMGMPYPLPGTPLFERVKDRHMRRWRPSEAPLVDHVLIFGADFSQAKMRMGLLKGNVQFHLRKGLGPFASPILAIFEKSTDAVLRLMR